MTSHEVRAVFEELLPQGEMDRLCRQCGVIERQRNLNLAMLVRAMGISAGTPGGAYQADILRAYLQSEAPQVTRAAFYRRFDEPLERFMAALAQRTLAYARAQQIHLPGPLSGVKDWYIVDSTTIKGRDARRDGFPGTGDYAALRMHTVLSVGCGAPVRYHFSPAREHDSPHLQIDESWRGYGVLADLASASLARLRACETYDVCFVIRLKDTWKPAALFPQDTPACLAHSLDHRRRAGASTPSQHPSATGRNIPDGGAAAHQALGLAHGGVLSVHRPTLRADRNSGQAAVGQNRRVAHPCGDRSQRAPSPVRHGSITGLEASARGSG